MIDVDALNKAIKYTLFSHEDALHHMAATDNLDIQDAYADRLQEIGDPDEFEFGVRMAQESEKQKNGLLPEPNTDRTNRAETLLGSLATSHKKPFVRVLAQKAMEWHQENQGTLANSPPNPYMHRLLDFLLSHDSKKDPTAHDIAIALSPTDKTIHPAAHSTVRAINQYASPYNLSGLQAKVVDGVVHLTNRRVYNPGSHKAPMIIAHAGANDPDEINAMVAKADEIVAKREAASPDHVHVGPAHMGPVAFSS